MFTISSHSASIEGQESLFFKKVFFVKTSIVHSVMVHPCCAVLQKLIAFLSLGFGIVVVGACAYTSFQVHKSFDTPLNEPVGNPEEDQKLVADKFGKTILGKIILGCSVAGAIAGATQCLASLCNLWSSFKNAENTLKRWLIVHILIFIALLVCIFLPFCFHNETGEVQSLTNIWNTLWASAADIQLKVDKIIQNVMWIYFIVLVLDEGLILLLMVLTCFSIPFANDTSDYYDDPIMPLTH